MPRSLSVSRAFCALSVGTRSTEPQRRTRCSMSFVSKPRTSCTAHICLSTSVPACSTEELCLQGRWGGPEGRITFRWAMHAEVRHAESTRAAISVGSRGDNLCMRLRASHLTAVISVQVMWPHLMILMISLSFRPSSRRLSTPSSASVTLSPACAVPTLSSFCSDEEVNGLRLRLAYYPRLNAARQAGCKPPAWPLTTGCARRIASASAAFQASRKLSSSSRGRHAHGLLLVPPIICVRGHGGVRLEHFAHGWQNVALQNTRARCVLRGALRRAYRRDVFSEQCSTEHDSRVWLAAARPATVDAGWHSLLAGP